ncbi:glycerol-3-phosphate phosphatase-like [Saccoglossus kowalevskii]
MNSCNGINPQKTVVIGDQLSSDILMGRRNGLKTLLVETGLNKRSDAMENMQSKSTERQKLVPDYFISSLAELGKEL